MNQPAGAYGKFVPFLVKDEVNTVLELGSRDGLDAIWFSQLFDADVVSWECNPYALPRMLYNLRHHPRIEPVTKAAWSSDERITFRPVMNGNIGASSVFVADHSYPYERPYQQEEVSVEAMRVDTWWAVHRPHTSVDLLAMDLQGAEVEALKGMAELLPDVKYVISEVQFKPLYHDTPLVEEITRELGRYGLMPRQLVEQNDWFGDALYMRRE